MKKIEDLKLYNTSTTDLYEIVFQDIVKNYIEEYNLYKGNSEDSLSLSETEIEKIAHNLIYDREYMWEIINDNVELEIENYINRKEEE